MTVEQSIKKIRLKREEIKDQERLAYKIFKYIAILFILVLLLEWSIYFILGYV
jgi:uncharacterized membrane protein YukC